MNWWRQWSMRRCSWWRYCTASVNFTWSKGMRRESASPPPQRSRSQSGVSDRCGVSAAFVFSLDHHVQAGIEHPSRFAEGLAATGTNPRGAADAQHRCGQETAAGHQRRREDAASSGGHGDGRGAASGPRAFVDRDAAVGEASLAMDIASDQTARQIYARLLRYAAPHWRMFAIAAIAMLVFAATNTGFAALMQPMIDGGFVKRDPAAIQSVPLMIIGLFLLRGLANFASAYCMAAVGRDVIHSLRRAMFDKLLQLPTRFYDKTSSGALLSKLIYDVEQVNQAATNALANVVRDGCTIIGLLVWMAYINWMLTVVIIVVGPPNPNGLDHLNRPIRRKSKRKATK